MKIIALTLAVLFVGSAEAKPQQYWTCVDAAGNKAAQDFPCPEPVASEPIQPAVQAEVPASQQSQAPQSAEPKRRAKPIEFANTSLIPAFRLIFWTLLAVLALKLVIDWIKAKLSKRGSHTFQKPPEKIEPSKELLNGLAKKSVPVAPTPAPKSPVRPTEWSLELIRVLEWKRFEELCAGYWQAKNYRAELTGKGADGGVDVNLYSQSEPARLFAVIQCKAQIESVGVEKLRELWGVANHLGVKMAMFYARAGYTEAARAFVVGKHLKLLTGEDLLLQIRALPIEQQKALLENITRGDYTTPTCSQCDVKMELKEARKGNREGNKFWGCVNYPKCNQTFHLNVARAAL